MLRFGLLLMCLSIFLGCALLFAFGSAGSPCFTFMFLCRQIFWRKERLVRRFCHNRCVKLVSNRDGCQRLCIYILFIYI